MIARLLTALVCLVVIAPVVRAADTPTHYALFTTTKYNVEDMAENIDLAITGLGFVIDHKSFIGRMLERTGKDTGHAKQIFVDARQFQFCPSTYSRNMMEANPFNIAFCPYIISVFSVPDDPKTVNVLYRRPLIVGSEESRKALQAVDDLLRSIVEEALR